MARCDVCGNEYAKAFTITRDGGSRTFDSFECAIHDMAPRCAHCGCAVVGHGIEAAGLVYCCAHCARHEGVTNVRDNAAHQPVSRSAARPLHHARDANPSQGFRAAHLETND